MNQLTFDGFLFYVFLGCVLLLLLGVVEFFWDWWGRRK